MNGLREGPAQADRRGRGGLAERVHETGVWRRGRGPDEGRDEVVGDVEEYVKRGGLKEPSFVVRDLEQESRRRAVGDLGEDDNRALADSPGTWASVKRDMSMARAGHRPRLSCSSS